MPFLTSETSTFLVLTVSKDCSGTDLKLVFSVSVGSSQLSDTCEKCVFKTYPNKKRPQMSGTMFLSLSAVKPIQNSSLTLICLNLKILTRFCSPLSRMCFPPCAFLNKLPLDSMKKTLKHKLPEMELCTLPCALFAPFIKRWGVTFRLTCLPLNI